MDIRVRPSVLAELRRVADLEAEGNVSFLVRRFVDEGLASRRAKAKGETRS